ncbi:hypothetical protein, partial [Hominenteromicrobium sp.]|uniref:hypothetical protein n=1 Tax=Hominenteromicrobium sp. TaxID=3073581 RepID=UPI003A95C7A0
CQRELFHLRLLLAVRAESLSKTFSPSTGFTSRLTIFSKTTGKNVFRGNIVPRNIDIFVDLL